MNVLTSIWKEDRSLSLIIVLVLSAHALIPFFIDGKNCEQKVKTSLVVRTVQLREKSVNHINEAKTPPVTTHNFEASPKTLSESKAPHNKAEKKESPKKEKPAQASPKKEVSVVKKPQSKLAPDKLQTALSKAKESLEKIDANTDKVSVLQAKTLKLIGSLSAEGVTDDSYFNEVVFHLKKHLKFPEYGSVDLLLTLSAQGNVLLLTIQKSQSALNKSYVERELPGIKFSPFNGIFAGKTDYIFHISLTNDE